jgi:hypothetical protein
MFQAPVTISVPAAETRSTLVRETSIASEKRISIMPSRVDTPVAPSIGLVKTTKGMLSSAELVVNTSSPTSSPTDPSSGLPAASRSIERSSRFSASTISRPTT